MRTCTRMIALVLACLIASIAAQSDTSPGALDTSFNPAGSRPGRVRLDFGTGRDDRGSAVKLHTGPVLDGKLIVVGAANGSTAGEFNDFGLARFTANGTIDTSFGGTGTTTTDFAGRDDVAHAVEIQPDESVVVAGCAGRATGSVFRPTITEFALARYDINGNLDGSFGGGKVMTGFTGLDACALALVRDPTGGFVAAGYIGADLALVRYSGSGFWDTSFGSGGKATLRFASTFSGAQASAIVVQMVQGVPRLLVAGSTDRGTDGRSDFALARFDLNGDPDLSFNGTGFVTTSFAGDDHAYALSLQADGKIVAAGYTSDGSVDHQFALARYDENGVLDTAGFGDVVSGALRSGKVTTDFAGRGDHAYSLVQQSDGKLVAAGYATSAAGGTGFALARYGDTGALDLFFGAGGKVMTPPDNHPAGAPGFEVALSLLLLPDGKLVAAGSTFAGGFDFLLARYLGGDAAPPVTPPVIDTGEPTQPGGPALFNSGTAFQNLAGQFVLSERLDVQSLKAWFGGIGGGNLTVRIYQDSANLPGPLVREQVYVIPSRANPGWQTFTNFTAALDPGTYWVAFEPGTGFFTTMPGGAPSPLAGYAYHTAGAPSYLPLIPNPGLGIQILGASVDPDPAGTSGTAARATLEGEIRGAAIPPQNVLDGAVSGNTTQHVDHGGVGGMTATGEVSSASLLSTRVYGTATGDPFCVEACTRGAGGARAIAYGEWRNNTAGTLSVRANAVLSGIAYDSLEFGTAAAAAYVLSKQGFLDTLQDIGGEAKFLLAEDDLADYAGISPFTFEHEFSLNRFFLPGALKTMAFRVERPAAAGIVSVPFSTPLTTVAPGESVVIMLDLSLYQPSGGRSDYYDTLKPADVFLTDENGNPSPLAPVGTPWAAPPPAIGDLAMTPEATTSQVASPVTVSVSATTPAGEPAAGATVFFEIVTGPNAQPLWPVATDADGRATFTYSGGATAGTDLILAYSGPLVSNAVQVTWTTPGALDHLTLSPATATITAGASQSYTSSSRDAFDNVIDDVTPATTFSIAPSGSCTGATCTPGGPGLHTVTATYLDLSASATLHVTAAPLDRITISPASATIAAGASQAYTTEALDLFGNSLGDVTASTTFTIAPDGSCTGAVCTAAAPGTHTVTATYDGKTASATLQVTGTTVTFTFAGFLDPIEMSTPGLVVWNTLKAGQAVPVKWLLTMNGVPVSDAASFSGLASYPVACTSGTGSVEDAIEQTATGDSGLQYNGSGYWQFNWDTSRAFKGSCRAVTVKFRDGTSSPAALFKFK